MQPGLLIRCECVLRAIIQSSQAVDFAKVFAYQTAFSFNPFEPLSVLDYYLSYSNQSKRFTMNRSLYLIPAFIAATSLSVYAEQSNAEETENTWADQQHKTVKQSLHSWSNNINDWLGETDQSKPASASLRVMMDMEWNRYSHFTYKPRVRGKIKLPVLKKHLSVVFGDEDIENQSRDKNRVGKNYENLERNRNYDARQARNDNASMALRWSNAAKEFGVKTDFDVGLRSMGDIFGRLRISKKQEWTENFSTRLEQIYRYGSRSRHYLRTNLENRYIDSDSTFIMNHTFLQYTHNKEEETGWGNSLYRQHTFSGFKTLSYGIFTGGRFDKDRSKFNTWGPFVTYRQPILRKWLFIQPEISLYNDKDNNRGHYFNGFMRLEAVF